MTDNEIINEWKDEIHRAEYIDSSYCDCIDLTLIKNTLDLINRQKAEIERLQGLANHHRNIINYLNEGIAEAKAEAYKEFVERLKNKKHECGCNFRKKPVFAVTEEKIDETYKEIEGGR